MAEVQEVLIYAQKCLLYRFNSENESAEGEWKARGKGTVKLFEVKGATENDNFVRIRMHDQKNGKLRLNHRIPQVELQPNAGSEKCWCWAATDFSDNESKGKGTMHSFAIKFQTLDLAVAFKKVYDLARRFNGGEKLKLPRAENAQASGPKPVPPGTPENKPKPAKKAAKQAPKPAQPQETVSPKQAAKPAPKPAKPAERAPQQQQPKTPPVAPSSSSSNTSKRSITSPVSTATTSAAAPCAAPRATSVPSAAVESPASSFGLGLALGVGVLAGVAFYFFRKSKQ